MTQISAKQVKELRERTGLGMMECKKALVEAEGNFEQAEDLLRIRGSSRASKVADRITAEGCVGIFLNSKMDRASLVEVNCETDFVAKDKNFIDFGNQVAELVVSGKVSSIENLDNHMLGSTSVEARREELVMKLGENLSVRRLVLMEGKGKIFSYLHGNRIGVLVDIEGGDDLLGKDLAMHIAAMKPKAIDRSGVPAHEIEREKEIAKTRAEESGKPDNIVEKIVEGTINKYLTESTLHGQVFVKDDKLSISQLLNQNNAVVHGFYLYVVGEGIERKSVDFAAEVREQANKVS